MITKSEAEKIKNILGAHYTTLVQEQLEVMGAKNKHGVTHTRNQIRVVLFGQSNSDVIENAIYKAVEKKLLENEKREALLNKKSAAATADS